MKYTIVISKSAEKELNNLPLKDFLSIDKKILALAENPHPAGVRKLTGYKYHFRLRSGKYRIVYTIRDKQLLIEIIRVGHRKDVYNF
jgi:mRNA interferase RelE/StbE